MRLITGTSRHWAVGPRFVARLPAACVTEDGRLRPEAAAKLPSRATPPAIDPDLYHLTVLVTTQCNLACAYCFQNTDLTTAGPPTRIPGATLDEDRVAQILAFGRRQLARRGASKLDLLLFGGEPTMYLDHCVALLDGCRELGLVSAAMISNGTLLTAPAAARLESAGLGGVQITFDGDRDAHDRSRITLGGKGSFDRILDNIAAASERTGLAWQLRVNLSGDTLAGADGLVDRLASRLDASKFTLYFAPVNDIGIGFLDTVDRSAEVAARVGGLYTQAIDAGFTVPMPQPPPVCITCGELGGGTGAVINSDGTLYSCFESAGRDGFEVGTLEDGYQPDDLIKPRWVACGYSTVGATDQRYRDTVDGMLLDALYERGLLAAMSNRDNKWTQTA